MLVRDLPEFAPLLAMDRSRWPRCLAWHGRLPGLGTAGERGPCIWALTLLRVLSFGMLLISGMLMIWLWVWRIILVSGWMGAGNSIPLMDLRLLVPVSTYLPLRGPSGMPFLVTVEECGDARLERCRAFMPVPGLSRLSSVLNSGRGEWGLFGLLAWAFGY